MQGLNDLLTSLHGKYLAQFNLYRFIQQPAFRAAYGSATNEEQKMALKYVEDVDQGSLTIWTKTVLRRCEMFELLDVRYLRDLARDQGIRNYSVMGRLELINHLRRRKEHETSASGVEERNGKAAGQVCAAQARAV